MDEYREHPVKRKWSEAGGSSKQWPSKGAKGKGGPYPVGKGYKNKGQAFQGGKGDKKGYCYMYNNFWCEKKSPQYCNYIHACSICGEKGHKAIDEKCGSWGTGGKAKDADKGAKGKSLKGAWTGKAPKGRDKRY